MKHIQNNQLATPSKLFNLIIGLFIFSAIVSGIVFLNAERDNKSSAVAVDIAGKNRMISQRILLLLHQWEEEGTDHKDEVSTWIEIHGSTLDSLQYGGEVLGDDGTLANLEPATGIALERLRIARENWVEYMRSVESVVNMLDETAQQEDIDSVFRQLSETAELQLEYNQRVVSELVAIHFVQETRASRLIELVTILNLLILIATIPFVRNPLKRIEKTNKERDEAFQKIEVQRKEMEEQSTDLLHQKEAMINLLEDLELEKNKLHKNEQDLYEAQKIGKIGSFVWNLQEAGGIWSEEAYALHDLEPKAGSIPFAFEQYIDLIHDDDREGVQKEMQKALTADTAELTYRLKLDNEELRWIRGRSQLERDKDGNPYRLKGTFQDVTQEHQIDQAKSEFVSLASHQLRTPLSSINWYTEMLLAGDAGKISKQQKEFLSEIEASSKRMVDLVNALLNVSRLELGTFMVQPEELQITELSDQVIKELQPKIKERKQTLSIDYDTALPVMNVDRKLMTIIFQNLLSNAVKYTPEGGEIALKIQKDEGTVQIVVSDTGMGIPKVQQEKIFSKLFRADNVRATDTEGTGLGLYIVKSVVEECGGGISFESEENKGTTFYVTMPLSGMSQKEGSRELN